MRQVVSQLSSTIHPCQTKTLRKS